MCCHVHIASGKLTKGFMTNHTINVFNRQNTTVSLSLKPKYGMKWPYVHCSALVLSFDFTFAVLYLHYYRKQHQVK